MSLIGQTTVIAMRDPLALSSLSRNPDFFFQNLTNFKKIQNLNLLFPNTQSISILLCRKTLDS
jgi:hypothetical protein